MMELNLWQILIFIVLSFSKGKYNFIVFSITKFIQFIRGAPHIHCLLWLEGEKGQKPPSMWNNDDEEEEELDKKIQKFADSVMSGSSLEMNCESCPVFNFDCEDCLAGKQLVEKYQSHKHTFSCKKKNKVCRILPTEGHGRLDYKIEGEELLAPVCRLRHPKYPMDETKFVRGFAEGTNEDEIKQAKKDYKKIRKYLLRLTHAEDFKESDKWKCFIKLTFNEFLH